MASDDAILLAIEEQRKDFRLLITEVRLNNERIDKHAEYWAIMFFVGRGARWVVGIVAMLWAGVITYLKLS